MLLGIGPPLSGRYGRKCVAKRGRAARMDGPPDRRGRGEGMTRKPLTAPIVPQVSHHAYAMGTQPHGTLSALSPRSSARHSVLLSTWIARAPALTEA